MKKVNWKIVFFSSWIIFIISSQLEKKEERNKHARFYSQRSYSVQKVDEHRVNLINGTDTIVLYLENSFAFTEETVFIEIMIK